MHPSKRNDYREILIAHACVFGAVLFVFIAVAAVNVLGQVSNILT